MKLYVLELWGNPLRIVSTKRQAERLGSELKEPTHEDEDGCYCSYSISEWDTNKRIGFNTPTWEYCNGPFK